jgi:hypothetical protein
MVLTVSFVLFPVIGLCCHRHQRLVSRSFDASVEASEPHDFTVREKRASSGALSRPPHPEPNVFDDRETPLMWARMARLMELIWAKREGIYFCNREWTGQIRLIRLNKLAFCENLRSLAGGSACGGARSYRRSQVSETRPERRRARRARGCCPHPSAPPARPRCRTSIHRG